MQFIWIWIRQTEWAIVTEFNTFQRMDLGECAKVHEYALRADFERSQKDKDYFYDVDVSLSLNSTFQVSLLRIQPRNL